MIFGPLDNCLENCCNPSDKVFLPRPAQGSRVHVTMDVSSTMHRRARQILLASLIALYGTMTAGGPALHALPGAEHVKSADGDGPDRPASSDHDCPICHFLAQGQLAATFTPVLSMDVVRIKPADDLPLTFPAAIARPSGPRAPPLA